MTDSKLRRTRHRSVFGSAIRRNAAAGFRFAPMAVRLGMRIRSERHKTRDRSNGAWSRFAPSAGARTARGPRWRGARRCGSASLQEEAE